MSDNARLKNKLVVFDMDGVLIDVAGSYREVVRRTINLYLEVILGVNIENKNWLSLSDIDFIKKKGGLNNDWDLTYSILNTVLINYFDEENEKLKDNFLEINNIGDEAEILKKIKQFRGAFKNSLIEKAIKSIDLTKVFDSSKWQEKRSPFLIYKGDVTSGNVIKRIFQEIYLGRDLFNVIYKQKSIFYHNGGLINNETLIPDKGDIERLSSLARLSIATGRPKLEAIYALKRFSIEQYFNPVITEDDIESASIDNNVLLRKPHPFIINECINRLNFNRSGEMFYIGDMPDDIEAAKRAGVEPIGFVNRGNRTEHEIEQHINILKKKGARKIVFNFNDLIKIVSH